MPMTKKKLRFLRRLIKHRLIGQRKLCPYCGESVQFEYLGKKKILIDIIRCTNCTNHGFLSKKSPDAWLFSSGFCFWTL